MKLVHCFIIFTLAFIALTSCKTTKKVPDGSYLLQGNSIEVSKNSVSKEEIDLILRQHPNRKFLFMKVKLFFYNRSNDKKDSSWVHRWLRKIGEPPVILDTNLTIQSVQKIKQYLASKGYFNAKVEHSFKFKKNKKAKVYLKITTPEPYTFRRINFYTADDSLENRIQSQWQYSLLKSGNQYDEDVLDKERERIAGYLKNQGYFRFSKEFINYQIDSSLRSNQMDVRLVIRDFLKKKAGTDSVIEVPHARYQLRNIIVNQEYNPLKDEPEKIDTVHLVLNSRNPSDTSNSYYFTYTQPFRIKPKTIAQSLFISSGNFFNLKDVDLSFNRLSDLRNFRFVNITFNDVTENDSALYLRKLDCKVDLTRSKAISYTFELEGTNSSGNYGIAGNFVAQHKNLFGGAEILNLKLRGAAEIQKVFGESKSIDLPLFNTLETGFDASLEFPKFLIPVSQERFSKYFKPKTTINYGYNFQKRPDFKRTINNISFGYTWDLNKYVKHILVPIEVNAVKIVTDSAFQQRILQLKDKRLQNQYTDHFILDLRYSYIFSDQELGRNKDFTYFRFNFESAGNLLQTANKILGTEAGSEGQYEIFKLRFAQYLRIDFDVKRYLYLNSQNTFVLRFLGGIGTPYGNSKVLPYEKGFFAGGTNNIRAWAIRSLGPGSYSNPSAYNFDRVGDLTMVFSAENRFPIYRMLKGALFVDAGNVWLNSPNESFSGGYFNIKDFYKEIAIGAGFGARFDFSYFVIRVDAAVPVRDPAKPESERWVIGKQKLSNFVLNFGIGYPF